MDAIGAISPAAPQLVQKHHALILLDCGHVIVLDARQRLLQLGQLVVVGRKQRAAAQSRLVVDILDHRAAVSVISTMKVLWPLAISSCAPIRVKIRSTIPISAASAGTNEPICAISTISAICRRAVLLPAMFGPVTISS